MDKNHQLNAPHNEELQAIHQLDDRSTVAASYPHARDQWDGDLTSKEEREAKRNSAQEKLHSRIRAWFPLVGALIPLPFIIMATFIALGSVTLDVAELGTFVIVPVAVAGGLFVWLTYECWRRVAHIFYNHSIKAMPYVIAHMLLMAAGGYQLFIFSQQFHHYGTVLNTLISGGIIIAASVIVAGPLLTLWSSARLGGGTKLLVAGGVILAVAVAQGTLLLMG